MGLLGKPQLGPRRRFPLHLTSKQWTTVRLASELDGVVIAESCTECTTHPPNNSLQTDFPPDMFFAHFLHALQRDTHTVSDGPAIVRTWHVEGGAGFAPATVFIDFLFSSFPEASRTFPRYMGASAPSVGIRRPELFGDAIAR